MHTTGELNLALNILASFVVANSSNENVCHYRHKRCSWVH